MPRTERPLQGAPQGGTSLATWLRTTAFRATLLHLVLTLLGTAALSGVAWWATTGYAARQVAQEVERGVGVLLQAARFGGPASVAVSVEARLAADRTGAEYYALTGPDGAGIAGNLAQAPRPPGWASLRLEPGLAGPATVLLAYGTPLPGGGFLVVARDLAPVRDLEARLVGAAGWVGGTALLLGLLGGAVIGRGVARRASAMQAALARVEAGDSGHRLPARPGGDEFDRLAARINAALDRQQAAMEAVRQVTDDVAHDLRTPLTRLRQRLEAALRATPANPPVEDAAATSKHPAPDGAAVGCATPNLTAPDRAAPHCTAPDCAAPNCAAPNCAALATAAEGALADCDRILGIFAALLRIAAVESGTRRDGFAPCDLTAVAQAVAEVYLPAAEERGQTLQARLAPGVILLGDRELLTQMLANLVENAIIHGRPGGQVLVSLAGGNGDITLAVADDGPGVPPEQREQVLRRFHRLEAARSQPGSGLGLALVAAVAALHGLRLTLADNAPGLRVTLRQAKGMAAKP